MLLGFAIILLLYIPYILKIYINFFLTKLCFFSFTKPHTFKKKLGGLSPSITKFFKNRKIYLLKNSISFFQKLVHS